MEAARTSSGSGTRHRRCRCCLPALTGFTTSRRGEADASHHGRARDGLHDVQTDWQKPAPRRAGTRSYHIGAAGNSPRSRALDFAQILRPRASRTRGRRDRTARMRIVRRSRNGGACIGLGRAGSVGLVRVRLLHGRLTNIAVQQTSRRRPNRTSPESNTNTCWHEN